MRQADALTDHHEQLRAWQRQGWLRAVDVSFAEFMLSDANTTNTDAQSVVPLASALVSYQLGRGHVALNLAQLFADPETTLQLPAARDNGAELERWGTPIMALRQWSLDQFKTVLAGSAGVADEDEDEKTSVNTPLVLAGERLYLRRYWHYQQQIQLGFELRAQPRKVNVQALRNVLNALFESTSDDTESEPVAVNWQKLACANTVRTGFSVITGGPGTGKTYTVVRLLATLQQLSMAEGGSERILLAAPTGKAAARMTESIRKELDELTLTDDVKRSIDPTAVTLHRLLGARPGSRGFRHHGDNPLMADTVIVDEASMVDVEMMALLLDALPRHARLVLLGDKDQLASVEAGAVLGNLCQGAEAGGYTKATLDWLETASGESLSRDLMQTMFTDGPSTSEHNPWLQHIVMLRHSRRFDEHSGIGKLAGEVNAMQSGWVRHWLAGHSPQAGEAAELYQSLTALMPAEPSAVALATAIKAGYGAYLECLAQSPTTTDAERIDTWALAVLTAFSSFQVLCAVREGDWGTHALNQRLEQWLGLALNEGERDHWYVGRPVMVTRNDYGLDLRNGDIGIVLHHPPSGTRRVAFITTENRVRWILPSRLTHVDTVYAMTVHKSQGSEFAHTMLVLPERDTPVLTKELLYTGITRAKSKLTLVVPNQRVLFDSMARCVERG